MLRGVRGDTMTAAAEAVAAAAAAAEAVVAQVGEGTSAALCVVCLPFAFAV